MLTAPQSFESELDSPIKAMEYSNPKIPEEINYSKENPLKEFAYLLTGILLILIAIVGVTNLLAQNYAQLIPFAYEKNLLPIELGADDDNPLALKKRDYLQQLTQKLAAHMQLPNEMQLHINYINNETINAGAALNGQILIYQGLLDFVQTENELSFILAHEIAHIKQRHPIKSLSSGLILSIAIAIISGSINNDGAASALMTGTTLTSLSFSRTQETQADALALNAVYQLYGHTQGSQDFFTRMQASEKLPGLLQFASTHPGLQDRLKAIELLSIESGFNTHENATLTNLPTLK